MTHSRVANVVSFLFNRHFAQSVTRGNNCAMLTPMLLTAITSTLRPRNRGLATTYTTLRTMVLTAITSTLRQRNQGMLITAITSMTLHPNRQGLETTHITIRTVPTTTCITTTRTIAVRPSLSHRRDINNVRGVLSQTHTARPLGLRAPPPRPRPETL